MLTQHLRIFVGAALLIGSGALLAAQSPATVAGRVKDAMLAQEVGWQLEKETVETSQFFQRWVNRAEDITFDYQVLASDADATDWLDKRPAAVSAPGGEPLAGVGDQALMWSRFTETGRATIYFRRGKATGVVSAPSQAIATRVARLFADQIFE